MIYNDYEARGRFLAKFRDVHLLPEPRTWWQAFLLALFVGTVGGALMVLIDAWCAP